MTKVRAPLTVEQSLVTIAATLGWAAMAEACRQKERTVRNWSDPDTPERCPVESAIQLDLAYAAAGGEGAPIYETYGLLLEAERAERFSSSAAIAESAIHVIKEGGDAHAALVKASRPGASPADLTSAMREVEENIGALTKTLPLLKQGMVPEPDGGAVKPQGGAAA